jgi:hypothetical protein
MKIPAGILQEPLGFGGKAQVFCIRILVVIELGTDDTNQVAATVVHWPTAVAGADWRRNL